MTEKMESEKLEKSIRLNMKQTSKGKWYGDATVRADTVEEATILLDKAMNEINKRSTVEE